MEYASHIPLDSVDTTKDEYLTYRSGVLEHSRGAVYVKALPEPAKPDKTIGGLPDEKETYDGFFDANKFSVRGSYDLDLAYCDNAPRATARRRRETQDSMLKGYVQSTLAAHNNQSRWFTRFVLGV